MAKRVSQNLLAADLELTEINSSESKVGTYTVKYAVGQKCKTVSCKTNSSMQDVLLHLRH